MNLKKAVILVGLSLLGLNAYAVQGTCGELRKGQNGFETVPVKCDEHPIPCAREWTDEKGNLHSEEVACKPGQQKTREQVEREDEAKQKRLCGKDFQSLRVGMSIARFEQCYEALSYITETVEASGVVETYQSTFFWIRAKSGRIVSYTRRTQ